MQKVLFILRELDDGDVDWLIKIGQREEVPPGTILIHEGHPVDTLYILLAGALVVSISALEGRQIARLATGEVVGEMSFIDSHPPSATVQTLEESVVLAISRSHLANKLSQDVGFAARFYRALAILLSHRLRGTVKQLGENREADGVSPNRGDRTDEAIAQARFERLIEQSSANP